MLERMSRDGVVWYESPALRELGAAHAFSTRLGGVSAGCFASLNLGNPQGAELRDADQNLEHNYRRLIAAAGLAGRQLRGTQQVHGARIVRVSRRPCDLEQADALVTDDPGCIISVRIADCVPILLASQDGRQVAAVHAGWRGMVAGIIAAAALQMRDIGAAAVGPCIGLDAFEVGPEVAGAFAENFGPRAPVRQLGEDKWQVDLREAARRQLLAAGVDPLRLDLSDRCTHACPEEFFSHRRDGPRTGRMAAIIGCAA
jgi:polyphenol oxidase